MSEGNSYRHILRSTTIIGGAAVFNILVGLLRTKVVAVVLGPAGLGLIGLLQNLMGTATVLSSLGFGSAGTRQIAEAAGAGDARAVATARRALFWGTLGLAASGAIAVWLLRRVLAEKILDDAGLAAAVGWLAIGVALSVASGSQGALLKGLRCIGDLVRISILAALLSTALGIGALWQWGEQGVLAFVLSAPLANFLLGHWFVSRLPKTPAPRVPLSGLVEQWKTLARLGTAFMVASLVVAIGHLAVRAIVQRDLDAEALGQFQAAWMISMTYIGFVLNAMSTDYYPRLTATIGDHATANRMVNEQTEVAMLLAGPVLLAMLGLAPWIVELLYSREFADAVDVLRWQVLGDILKVASWPLGFIILAAGDGRTFMGSEALATVAFVGLTWIGLPMMGVEATGVAFLGMYLLYLPLVYWLARRRTKFSWQRRVRTQFLLVIGLAVGVFLAAFWSKWLGAALGTIASIGLGLRGLVRLGQMTGLDGRLGRVGRIGRSLMMKLGLRHD